MWWIVFGSSIPWKLDKHRVTTNLNTNMEVRKYILQSRYTIFPGSRIGKVNPCILFWHLNRLFLPSVITKEIKNETINNIASKWDLFPLFPYLLKVNSYYISMLSSFRHISARSTLYKVFASRFSTLNPVQEAERVTEVRNILNSVHNNYYEFIL